MKKVQLTALAVTAAGAALLALSACGGNPVPAPVSHAPAVTQAAAPAAAGCAALYATWYTVYGQPDMTAVEADLRQITADARAENLVSVESDGTQLSADALQALAGTPPECADPDQDYVTSLNYLASAGANMAQGSISLSGPEISSGAAYFGDFAAEPVPAAYTSGS
jgi:hypothetical protein